MNLDDGKVVASSVSSYPHKVITDYLPNTKIKLQELWCLQDPDDYLNSMQKVIAEIVHQAEANQIEVNQIMGLGIDFTCCTVMPIYSDGTPMMKDEKWVNHPHAWVKLWKHHAAQPQAEKINSMARKEKQEWLSYYGGKVSSEWFFPKLLQILEEDPDLYEHMDKFIEAGDWIVWQLTGKEMRNESSAGYKAMYQRDLGGFPDTTFFEKLNPKLKNVVSEKINAKFYPPGTPAGNLTLSMAEKLHLSPNTVVAVNNIDAHVCVAATGVTQPEVMLSIIGTSSCDILLTEEGKTVEGAAGIVKNGAIFGAFAYETGQSAVGDLFSWYVEQNIPHSYYVLAEKNDNNLYQFVEKKAAELLPGESGLLALDWWNGNRSILMDAELTGSLVGMTLQTKPEDIFRALIEATAFGKRIIIENFEKNNIAIKKLIFCGGLPHKNKLLNQIYADILDKTITVSSELETAAKSSAIFASIACGEFEDIQTAVDKVVEQSQEVFTPNRANKAIYDTLYQEYLILSKESTPKGSVMKELFEIKKTVKEAIKNDKPNDFE